MVIINCYLLYQLANQLLIVFRDVLSLLCEKPLYFTDSPFQAFILCQLHLSTLFCLTKAVNLV